MQLVSTLGVFMSLARRRANFVVFVVSGLLTLQSPSFAGDGSASEKPKEAKSAYTAADIVVEYRDAAGKALRPPERFKVDKPADVAALAAHFPGILAERGSGPKKSDAAKTKFTVLFHHKDGDESQMRVAHVSADYSLWRWRDNTPYTGDRQVEGKDQLRKLIERLAAEHKVKLK
jgi:hypothetical protein